MKWKKLRNLKLSRHSSKWKVAPSFGSTEHVSFVLVHEKRKAVSSLSWFCLYFKFSKVFQWRPQRETILFQFEALHIRLGLLTRSTILDNWKEVENINPIYLYLFNKLNTCTAACLSLNYSQRFSSFEVKTKTTVLFCFVNVANDKDMTTSHHLIPRIKTLRAFVTCCQRYLGSWTLSQVNLSMERSQGMCKHIAYGFLVSNRQGVDLKEQRQVYLSV